jgi:hypothetical protein
MKLVLTIRSEKYCVFTCASSSTNVAAFPFPFPFRHGQHLDNLIGLGGILFGLPYHGAKAQHVHIREYGFAVCAHSGDYMRKQTKQEDVIIALIIVSR